MLTLHQKAALRGYPATLFGRTSAHADYWREPGLPTHYAPALAVPTPAGSAPWSVFEFTTDVMGPRFPKGCRVGLTPVRKGQTHYAGLYVWPCLDRQPGAAYVGRLQAEGRFTSRLHLTLDNYPRPVVCVLAWDTPGFALYRVTHYETLPDL